MEWDVGVCIYRFKRQKGAELQVVTAEIERHPSQASTLTVAVTITNHEYHARVRNSHIVVNCECNSAKVTECNHKHVTHHKPGSDSSPP